MTAIARLLFEPFDPADLLARFMAGLPGTVGGVVSFVGRARGTDLAGQPVERLFLQHHPRLTEASMQEIADDGAVRFDVAAVDVAHRCGPIDAGEAIVWVAVGAPHRRAAFEAADYLMDRLKTDAVFWKREERADGSAWIEPSERDHGDRARWGAGEWLDGSTTR